MRREHGRDASDGEDSVKLEYRVASTGSRVERRIRDFSVFRTWNSVLFPLLLSVLLLSQACGYHTAGHAAQLPESVHTIAVPAFKNETVTYRIEQMLTASVVREFTTRTRYHIVSEPGDDADATLRGIVLSTTASPLTYDTATGRAASVLVVVSMRVSLTDRQGKVLYQNPAYLFREQYEVSQDLASFFEEDSPAFRRLSQDFARTLVANVLEGF
jgi:outer membrane lipopolysaccharide assembly protein LptE/RlpB